MNTKLDKKLNPYLYPFKMKCHKHFLYPQIVVQTAAQQFLNTSMNLIQINTNKACWCTEIIEINNTTRNKIFIVSENLSDSGLPLAILNNMAITSDGPKPTHAFESSNPESKQYKPHSDTLKKLKSTAVLDMPRNTTVTLEGQKILPKPLVFDRPKFTDIIGRPAPEDVSWTRIDRAQRRLDMIPLRLKVAMGVVSGMIATTAVHPLDVIKVRLQLFPKKITTMNMLHRITVCEGMSGLYAGLTAGLLRQLTYTGSRLFAYNSLYDNYKKEKGKSPDFSERLGIAIVAGMVGAFMGTPSELALVRIIELQRLRRSRCSPPCTPVCKHVQYPSGAVLKLFKIYRREGIKLWWRGGVPTVIRSIFVTTAQVGVYTEIRQMFTKGEYQDTGIKVHLYTAVCSSLVSTLLSLPVDQVKTRYQSYQLRHSTYRNIIKNLLRTKGVWYLWKGFVPYYVRQVVHTVISYVVLDALIDEYVEFQEAKLRPK